MKTAVTGSDTPPTPYPLAGTLLGPLSGTGAALLQAAVAAAKAAVTDSDASSTPYPLDGTLLGSLFVPERHH